MKKVLSVTIKDCEIQTFRAGGPGGQNQNKRDTGVRVVHRPSGAVGECREERSQLTNKQRAFGKMARSPKFQFWIAQRLHHGPQLDAAPRPKAKGLSDLDPANLRVEGRSGGQWVVID